MPLATAFADIGWLIRLPAAIIGWWGCRHIAEIRQPAISPLPDWYFEPLPLASLPFSLCHYASWYCRGAIFASLRFHSFRFSLIFADIAISFINTPLIATLISPLFSWLRWPDIIFIIIDIAIAITLILHYAFHYYIIIIHYRLLRHCFRLFIAPFTPPLSWYADGPYAAAAATPYYFRRARYFAMPLRRLLSPAASCRHT